MGNPSRGDGFQIEVQGMRSSGHGFPQIGRKKFQGLS